MTVFEGNLTTGNAKYGIVVARFNEFINAKLLAGALD
ncbi:MAG: 6,7-dimethyl-8-ribityllumazine synthase, partial [Lactococcus cremoris]